MAAYKRMTTEEKFEYLKTLYHERLESNPRAFEEISSVLEDAEDTIKEDARKGGVRDIGQSWRAWKGNNFERLVHYIVSDMIERRLPFKVIEGKNLEKRQTDPKLGKVKRNVLVDFGKHGCHLPDTDIVVYDPDDLSVKAIISCKVSLRERVAQTAFWKMKLKTDSATRHIKMFFATTDSDREFFKANTSKPAAIAMSHCDAVFVLRTGIQERDNVYTLPMIADELTK